MHTKDIECVRAKELKRNENENELKWIEIFFYSNVLNSEYFFLDLIGFNWIQLAPIGCNWIEKLHFLFKILNIHNAQKKLILFLELKRIRICSMQFL